MEVDPAVQKFLEDICLSFPEIRELMDRHDDYMSTSKMMEFADATTKAFATGDKERGISYMDFMSKRLDPANVREFEYIDVYYVECLFHYRGEPAARLGWPLVPANLKDLYLRFHGIPPI
jgi:hypothetical protein